MKTKYHKNIIFYFCLLITFLGCDEEIFRSEGGDFKVKSFISNIKSYNVNSDFNENIMPTDISSADKPYVSVQSWVIKGKDILMSITVPDDALELYFGAINSQAEYMGLNFSGQEQNTPIGYYRLQLSNISNPDTASNGLRNYQVVLSSNKNIQLNKFDLIVSCKTTKGISNKTSVPIDVINIAPYQENLKVGFKPLTEYTYTIQVTTPTGSQVTYSYDKNSGIETFNNSQVPNATLSYDSGLDFKWIDFSDPQFGGYTMTATIQIDLSGGSQYIYLYLAIITEGIIDQVSLDADIQQTGPNTAVGTANVGFSYFEELSVKINMLAFRAQSEYFNAEIVPDSEKIQPGVGIRYNGDNKNENLIKVILNANPITPPEGVVYLLKRNNQNIKVWGDPYKIFPILDNNNEKELHFSINMEDVYVENVVPGNSNLEFVAIQNNSILSSDMIVFSTFNSMIIVLGGRDQEPHNYINPSYGAFHIGLNLYSSGYNVHIYNENEVPITWPQNGQAVIDIINGINNQNIFQLGIFGYSYGGGATYRLCEYLNNNSNTIGSFEIDCTGYIDAFQSLTVITAEERLPPGSNYHVNYYQQNELVLQGAYVPGADFNKKMLDVDHLTIDDNSIVKDGIKNFMKQIINPW